MSLVCSAVERHGKITHLTFATWFSDAPLWHYSRILGVSRVCPAVARCGKIKQSSTLMTFSCPWNPTVRDAGPPLVIRSTRHRDRLHYNLLSTESVLTVIVSDDTRRRTTVSVSLHRSRLLPFLPSYRRSRFGSVHKDGCTVSV